MVIATASPAMRISSGSSTAMASSRPAAPGAVWTRRLTTREAMAALRADPS